MNFCTGCNKPRASMRTDSTRCGTCSRPYPFVRESGAQAAEMEPDEATFDLFAAEAARDTAIEQVEVGAGPEWMERALRLVRSVAETREEFTTDRLHALMEPKPKEGRVWGAVMRKVAEYGWAEPTGVYRKSASVVCHARPKMIWRSRIYRKEAA